MAQVTKNKRIEIVVGSDETTIPTSIDAMGYFNDDAEMNITTEVVDNTAIVTGNHDTIQNVKGMESGEFTAQFQTEGNGSGSYYDVGMLARAFYISGLGRVSDVFKLTMDTVENVKRGDTVTGGTSGESGIVVSVGSDFLHVMGEEDFSVGEEITSPAGVVGNTTDVKDVECYAPNLDVNDNEVGSIFYWADGYLKQIKNAVGNFTLTAESSTVPMFDFTFIGPLEKDNWKASANPSFTRVAEQGSAFKNADTYIQGRDDLVSRVTNFCAQSFSHDLGATTVNIGCFGAEGGNKKGNIQDRNGATLNLSLYTPEIADWNIAEDLCDNDGLDVAIKQDQWTYSYTANPETGTGGTANGDDTMDLVLKPYSESNLVPSFVYIYEPT